jgi:hypothetical protein
MSYVPHPAIVGDADYDAAVAAVHQNEKSMISTGVDIRRLKSEIAAVAADRTSPIEKAASKKRALEDALKLAEERLDAGIRQDGRLRSLATRAGIAAFKAPERVEQDYAQIVDRATRTATLVALIDRFETELVEELAADKVPMLAAAARLGRLNDAEARGTALPDTVRNELNAIRATVTRSPFVGLIVKTIVEADYANIGFSFRPEDLDPETRDAVYHRLPAEVGRWWIKGGGAHWSKRNATAGSR